MFSDTEYTHVMTRIRVELHISLLGHALTIIDAPNPVRQVVPDIGQTDRLHPVRVVMGAAVTTGTHRVRVGLCVGGWGCKLV